MRSCEASLVREMRPGLGASAIPPSLFLLLAALLGARANAQSQLPNEPEQPENTLSGGDRNQHDPTHQHHFFGEWGGKRSKLLSKGINLDFQYEGDLLWNVQSPRPTRSTDFSRGRGTIDIDFAKLTGTPGWKLHVTAVWQGGANLGTYLGQFTGPSGLASENSLRLDSWWVDKTLRDKCVYLRLGQFAAADFCGNQLFGPSFVFEPLQYALGNLNVTYETSDPPSTSAAELRFIPAKHLYVKSMVYAADRLPFAHNLTGLVPDFRSAVSSASEIGWSPGKKAYTLLPQDSVEDRKGYAGLYQFGAVFNPGKFRSARPNGNVSGDYLLYGMLNQAVYRTSSNSDRGLDLTAGVDWSPSDRNRTNQVTDVGLRLNEPLPTHLNNTVGLAWVRTGIGKGIALKNSLPPQTAEHGLELNLLLELPHGILVQPVAQYYIHSGGSRQSVCVLGLHTKVAF